MANIPHDHHLLMKGHYMPPQSVTTASANDSLIRNSCRN